VGRDSSMPRLVLHNARPEQIELIIHLVYSGQLRDGAIQSQEELESLVELGLMLQLRPCLINSLMNYNVEVCCHSILAACCN
jgi:hypothetical protein